MIGKSVPIEEIKQLANDVRTIRDFAENYNFDASLIDAQVEPKRTSIHSWDWPLILTAIFVVALVVAVGVLSFWENLPSSWTKFLFTLGLLAAVLSSICLHKKFENNTITIIAGLGLVFVLLIGAGIFTPKEAVVELQKLQKK